MIATETPTCIISIKIVAHIFAAEIFTGISVAETSNCIIATETVTFIIRTKRYTNLSVAESTTNIIAIESVGCTVSKETATCKIDYRNFHLK